MQYECDFCPEDNIKVATMVVYREFYCDECHKFAPEVTE